MTKLYNACSIFLGESPDEYIDAEPQSSRPSVPSFDLTRPSLASRFSFGELAQRPSVHFEGFDDVEVIPRIPPKPLIGCYGKMYNFDVAI